MQDAVVNQEEVVEEAQQPAVGAPMGIQLTGKTHKAIRRLNRKGMEDYITNIYDRAFEQGLIYMSNVSLKEDTLMQAEELHSAIGEVLRSELGIGDTRYGKVKEEISKIIANEYSSAIKGIVFQLLQPVDAVPADAPVDTEGDGADE